MTTAADDSAVEEAFEAFLAGRAVPDQGAGLAAFSDAVRTTALQPGRPSAALAELLATGLLTDQSSPSTRTATSAGRSPSRASRIRIRRRFAMFLPALIAKFLSAGAVAQAASGAGVVLVVLTGAGAADVLPEPVQDTVATVVETVSPLELPDSGDATEGTDSDGAVEGDGSEPTETEAPVTDAPVTDAPVTDAPVTDAPDPAEPTAANGLGQRVSEQAHNGGVDGQQVREWAHTRNDQRRGTPAPTAPAAPTTAAPDDSVEDEDATDQQKAGSGGQGGNSGHGGRGHG
jgi:hypothetical protein